MHLTHRFRATMLLMDGLDAERIEYIKGFKVHYRHKYHPQGQADGESKYQVLEDLIPVEALEQVNSSI